MRNFTVSLVSGLVALMGFAGSASASATIDLIWAATGTSNISGAQATSANIVLNVVLTAGPLGSIGGGLTVDYSTMLGEFAYVSSANTPSSLPIFSSNDPINGWVLDVGWGTFIPTAMVPGATQLLGAITFDSLPAYAGGPLTVTSFIRGLPAADDILDGLGIPIDPLDLTYNSATVNAPVPEPGTLSLLGMGLGGLYVVGRRSSRKH
jgi:hypothetical protein